MLVWLVFLVGGIWGGLSLDRILFPAVYRSLWFHMAGFLVGLGLLRLVMTVSRNTGRTLAKYGREGKLPRMETNRIVTAGVYRYMRHPMHLGLLFFPFAFAFLVGSPSFVFMIAPAEAILILLLIKWIEEPEAIRKFGTEYLNYMSQTPWFCFKRECLYALLKKVEK